MGLPGQPDRYRPLIDIAPRRAKTLQKPLRGAVLLKKYQRNIYRPPDPGRSLTEPPLYTPECADMSQPQSKKLNERDGQFQIRARTINFQQIVVLRIVPCSRHAPRHHAKRTKHLSDI